MSGVTAGVTFVGTAGCHCTSGEWRRHLHGLESWLGLVSFTIRVTIRGRARVRARPVFDEILHHKKQESRMKKEKQESRMNASFRTSKKVLGEVQKHTKDSN